MIYRFFLFDPIGGLRSSLWQPATEPQCMLWYDDFLNVLTSVIFCYKPASLASDSKSVYQRVFADWAFDDHVVEYILMSYLPSSRPSHPKTTAGIVGTYINAQYRIRIILYD